jgi:hypothetical protein
VRSWSRGWSAARSPTTSEGKVASTQDSLFVAGNVAIAYVVFADTRFHSEANVERVVYARRRAQPRWRDPPRERVLKLGLFRKKPARDTPAA